MITTSDPILLRVPVPDSISSVSGLVRRIPRLFTLGRRRPVADAILRDHGAIAEFAYDALIGMTLDGVVRSWNHAAIRLFGYLRPEIIGRHISVLVTADRVEEQSALMARASEGALAPPIETVARRHDGTTVPIELNFMPIRDRRGAVVALAGAARDISSRKRAEAHRALLAHELGHRLKNTLATVQSIARFSMRGAASMEDFQLTFSARLDALSKTHTLLTSRSWEGAPLWSLVEGELSPYALAGAPRWMLSGPPIDLAPRRALAVGMVLHELTTNAVKHGALSLGAGRVHVSWEIRAGADSPRLKLTWRESGGPPVARPSREGFGLRLVTHGLPYELNGQVELAFPRTGVHCEIDFPIESAEAAL